MQQQRSGGRGKAYLFLGISLGAAVLSAVLIIQLLKRTQHQLDEARKPPETVDVVIAARTLYMGVPITDVDIYVRSMLPEMVPADHIFTSGDIVVGRTPKERILPNEVVRTERLARIEDGVGLNAVITPGKRAMAVAISADAAVAGLIEPLNYVDVVGVVRPDENGGRAKAVANTILENVKVLAVGARLTTNSDTGQETDAKGGQKKKARGTTGFVRGKRTVTLELTPEDGHKLALATVEGEIMLMLRADTDITHVPPVIVGINDVIGWQPQQELSTAPIRTASKGSKGVVATPAGPGATVISGPDVQGVQFDDGGTAVEVDRRRKRNK